MNTPYCRLLFCLAFVIFSSITLNAQNPDVDLQWGKEKKVYIKDDIRLIGKGEDNYLGLNHRKANKVGLVKYRENDMGFDSEQIIIGKAKKGMKAIGKEYEFEKCVYLQKKILLFVTKYDKKSKKNTLHVQEISREGKLTGKLKKIAQIQGKKKSNAGSYEIVANDDSTGFLLVNNPPFDKYNNEKFKYTIFDSSMSVTNELELELPYKDKFFAVTNYIFSDDKKIFMLAQIFIDMKQKKKEEKERRKKEKIEGKKKGEDDPEPEASYYYEVIAISPENKGSLTEFEVKLPQKYISDVSFALDVNNNPICAGFYGELNKKGKETNSIKGIFYMRLNKETRQVDASSIKEFDNEFITELSGKRAVRKGKGISNTFKLNNFITKSDGGVILIGESAFEYSVTVCRPNGGCVTTYHYESNHIIVINVTKEGNIKWYANIPKYQHTVNDGGYANSYAMHIKNDKMYFIYNDNPKNYNNPKIRKPSDMKVMGNPGKAVAIMVTLSEDGKFTKSTLFDSKKVKSTILPKEHKQIGENEYLFSCFKPGFYINYIPIVNSRSRLLKVNF